MKKRELNSIKTALAHFKTANANGGYYCPSDAQTEALKNLYAETSGIIGKRESIRLAQLLMSIDNANINEVYCVDASEEQIAAIEKAMAAVEVKGKGATA